jgi:hypothetical protein
MFEGFSPTARLLIVVLLLAVSTVLLAYWKIGTGAAALVSLTICAILWISKSLWISSAATRVRLNSVKLRKMV